MATKPTYEELEKALETIWCLDESLHTIQSAKRIAQKVLGDRCVTVQTGNTINEGKTIPEE